MSRSLGSNGLSQEGVYDRGGLSPRPEAGVFYFQPRVREVLARVDGCE